MHVYEIKSRHRLRRLGKAFNRERHLHKLIELNPSVLFRAARRKGFWIHSRYRMPGSPDLTGIDSRGGIVLVEIKRASIPSKTGIEQCRKLLRDSREWGKKYLNNLFYKYQKNRKVKRSLTLDRQFKIMFRKKLPQINRNKRELWIVSEEFNRKVFNMIKMYREKLRKYKCTIRGIIAYAVATRKTSKQWRFLCIEDVTKIK